jgi:DNA-binding SARP family transcriptional activator
MLALYRCGRQSDALAAYRQLYQKLDDELGIQPSAPLRDLRHAILAQDDDLDRPHRTAHTGDPTSPPLGDSSPPRAPPAPQ